MISYVAKQLDATVDSLNDYDLSGRSSERHRATIRTHLDYAPSSTVDQDRLNTYLTETVVPHEVSRATIRDCAIAWYRVEQHMPEQNTLYIAEPLFSAKLLRFQENASFPPIKKIGITTDTPEQRQKELLGTKSLAKIRIVKAWTNVDARSLESFVHKMLDGLRLDGEYFWDEIASLL